MANHSWENIYIKNAPKLLGVCRRYIKDIALAEDLMHETFITAIQKHNDYRGSGSIEAWLHKIMVNTALNYLRATKNNQMISDENIDIIDNLTDEMSNLNTNIKTEILSADFTQPELLEAIDSIPNHHKSVFNMYVIDKFSHIEIAKTLDITVGTSKSHLSRARKKIQDFLHEKAKNTEEKKRKRGVLFIFFALNGHFIDKMYSKSFNNFSIQPQKEIDIASISKQHSIPKTIKTTGFLTKRIFFLTFGLIVLITTGIYFFQQKNAVVPIVKQQENTKVLNDKNLITKANKPNTIQTKNIRKIIKKPTDIKTVIISNNTNSDKKQDTDTIKPKPVIIKKQIIVRDTIYVK